MEKSSKGDKIPVSSEKVTKPEPEEKKSTIEVEKSSNSKIEKA